MDSPRGRIYLMRAAAEGRTTLTPGLARHLDLCLGCRACETACPSGVPFGRLLETTRARARADAHAGARDRPCPARACSSRCSPIPTGWALSRGRLRAYQRSGLRAAVRGLRPARAVQAPADAGGAASVASLRRRRAPARGDPRARAAAWPRGRCSPGCVQRVFYPHVNVADGAPARGGGLGGGGPARSGLLRGAASARRAARRVPRLRAGAAAGVPRRPRFRRHERRRLRLRPQGIRSLAARSDARSPESVRDVTEVLADATLPLGELPLTVTYHDACHLAHGQKRAKRAAGAPAPHPRAAPGGAGGQRSLLRKRGRLQYS